MEKINYDSGGGSSPVPPVPLTVLTGFLGAGKTTLLNRILNGNHGLRVAVLVNDFGSINIDAELIIGVESGIISLANGCICCSIRDDLVQAVTTAIQRPERPEYILLEASGVAEPSGIAATFMGHQFRDRIRLDSITCVVDAEQALAVPELMELKLRQLAFSDLLILNKIDLVDDAQLSRVRAWLDSRLYRYRRIEACRCDVPLEILLGVGRFDPSRMEEDCSCPDPACGHHGHEHQAPSHAQLFATWTYQTKVPLSLELLRTEASRLPVGVYRAKGIVQSVEAPRRRAVLQVVGKRVDISLAGDWNVPVATRIVAIGRPGSIDDAQLRERLGRCLAQPVAARS